jgi:hypothetical protein
VLILAYELLDRNGFRRLKWLCRRNPDSMRVKACPDALAVCRPREAQRERAGDAEDLRLSQV